MTMTVTAEDAGGPGGNAHSETSGQHDDPSHATEATDLRDESAARGAVVTFVGTVAGAAANFGMLAVVARLYGAQAFGVFSGIVALFLVLTMVTRLGADVGATWFVTRLVTQRAGGRVPALLRVALAPVVIASAFVALLLLVASRPIAALLSDDASRDAFAGMLTVIALVVPLATVGEVLLGATRGYGAMRPTVVASQLGRQVGQLVTVAAAAAITRDLRVLALAWALPYVGTVLYPAWWLRKVSAEVEPSPGPGLWSPFWRYSGPQGANQTAQIGLEKFDIILLGPLAGVAAQGGYNAANRLAHLVALAWYAINLAHGPVWARLFEQKRHREVARSAQMVSTWGILFVAPLLWAFVVFGTTWTGLVGEGLSIGGSSLVVLALGLLVALVLGPCENLLLMAGASGRSFVNNLIALVVNIGLNLLLIRRFGAVGAAIAWVAALVLVRGLASAHLWRTHRVRSWSKPLAEGWVLAAVAAGGCALVARLLLGNGVLALVLAVFTGWPLVAFVAWKRRERFHLAQLLSSVLRRGQAPDDPSPQESGENGPVRAAVSDFLHTGSDPGAVVADGLVTSGTMLELRIRSRAAIALPCTPGQMRLLLDVVPAAGWRGRMTLAVISHLAPLFGRRAYLLPLLRRRPLDLPVDPQVVLAAVRRSASVLDRSVDGLLWLLPPEADDGRMGALLLDGDQPVGHLRLQVDTSWVPRPRAEWGRGARSGVEWPVVLDRWFVGGIRCELSTALRVCTHRTARLSLPEVLDVVDDITDALAPSSTPPGPGLGAVHGDLTPWNLRRSADGRLVLFDWEHASYAPPATDLVRILTTGWLPDDDLAKLPPDRLAACRDAILYWQRIENDRAVTEHRVRWKRRTRNRTAARLQLLADLAVGDPHGRAARVRRALAGQQAGRLLPAARRHRRFVLACAGVGAVGVGALSWQPARVHVAAAEVVLRDPWAIDPTLIERPVGGDFERFVRQQALFAVSPTVIDDAALRSTVDPQDLAERATVAPDAQGIALSFSVRAGSTETATAQLDQLLAAYGEARARALAEAVTERLGAVQGEISSVDAEIASLATAKVKIPAFKNAAPLEDPAVVAATDRRDELEAEAADLRLGVERYGNGVAYVQRAEVRALRPVGMVVLRTVMGALVGLTVGMAAAWFRVSQRRN